MAESSEDVTIWLVMMQLRRNEDKIRIEDIGEALKILTSLSR